MERIAGGRPRMQGVFETWWETIFVCGSIKHLFRGRPQGPFLAIFKIFGMAVTEEQVKVFEIPTS